MSCATSMRTKLVGYPERLTQLRRAQLDLLDLQCFPEDDPFDKRLAYWWMTFHESGQIVAFAGLQDLGRGTGFLCRAGVLPAWRGYGLQKALVRRRCIYARSLGLSELVTYTTPENYASLNNLVSCGFRFWKGPDLIGVPAGFPYLRNRL